MSEESTELHLYGNNSFDDLWEESHKFDRIRMEIDPGNIVIFTNVRPYYEPPYTERGYEKVPGRYTLVSIVNKEEVLRFEKLEEVRNASVTVGGKRFTYFRKKGVKGSRCPEETEE